MLDGIGTSKVAGPLIPRDKISILLFRVTRRGSLGVLTWTSAFYGQYNLPLRAWGRNLVLRQRKLARTASMDGAAREGQFLSAPSSHRRVSDTGVEARIGVRATLAREISAARLKRRVLRVSEGRRGGHNHMARGSIRKERSDRSQRGERGGHDGRGFDRK